MPSSPYIGLIFIIFVTLCAGQFNTFPQRNVLINQSPANQLTSFPSCFSNNRALNSLLNPDALQFAFDRKLQEEESKLIPSSSNVNLRNTGIRLHLFSQGSPGPATRSRQHPRLYRCTISTRFEEWAVGRSYSGQVNRGDFSTVRFATVRRSTKRG